MLGFKLSVPAFCGIAMLLAGCGSSIWTVSRTEQVPEHIDGAVLEYALANGQVALTSEWKASNLTISAPQSVKATPDYGSIHRLIYNHNEFSDDEIEVKMDGALVTSLSSTTEDKSTAVAKGLTDLFTQVGQTRTDLNKFFISEKIGDKNKDEKPKPSPCPDMTAVTLLDVTHGRRDSGYYTTYRRPDCSITIEFDKTVLMNNPKAVLGVSGFVSPLETSTSESYCDLVFCFRRTGAFTIKARAVMKMEGQVPIRTEWIQFDVMAPSLNLAFIRFNRRAFVANKTEIEFQNGIVSRFHAKNPSEVVGFLELPTQVLKGVSAAIIIH